MSKHIEIESNMRFSFDASKWASLMQYDLQTDYKKMKDTVQETKVLEMFLLVQHQIGRASCRERV